MSDLLAAPSSRRKALLRILQLLFLLALFLPGILYAEDKYWLRICSRVMAMALFALSVDLVWGYTGLLSLGQGLYFGLGAYAVGYSLKLREAANLAGNPYVAAPDMALPTFMVEGRVGGGVPGWMAPLIDLRLALVLAILLPVVVGTVFGLLVFKRRIKSVYFSLITQALVLAVFTFVVQQRNYTGGIDGMNNLAKLELFGVPFQGVRLYFLIASLLALCYLGCLLLMRSKFGKVLTAIRDNEYRVQALGYNTAMYKTFVMAFAGALAGLAGALYVSVINTAGPDSFGIAFSIEAVIFVAVGGRGTLVGAVLGTVLVNLANTYLNNEKQLSWDVIRLTLFVGALALFHTLLFRASKKLLTIEAKWWLTLAISISAAAGLAYGVVWLADAYVIRPTDESWPLILGGLFIGVVVFLPDGIVGGFRKLDEMVLLAWKAWRRGREETLAVATTATPAASLEPVRPAVQFDSTASASIGVQTLAGESQGM